MQHETTTEARGGGLRIAVIGVGNRGRMAIDYFKTTPGWSVVALVDESETILREAAELARLPPSHCFSDAQEAFAALPCDAVFICTPTATHAHYCRIAFRHRLHVLVEKAMTNCWEEAQELVRLAEEAGVCFCVAQNYRFARHCRSFAAVANDSGHPCYPGRIEMVDYIHHIHRPRVRRLTFPYSMVWDMACHHMDLLLSILGRLPDRVRSEAFAASWTPYNHPPNLRAWLDFGASCRVQYLLTFDAPVSSLHIALIGERGTLRLDHRREIWFHPAGGDEALPVAQPSAFSASGFRETVEGWRDYIDGGTEPVHGGRRNLEVLRLCQSLIESAEARDAVTLCGTPQTRSEAVAC
ncbi:MAG TPA: Gfo/Idh/MocA family oxidoreductase [Chthoniobacteraceae bacterium]|nr:Gfo/Idh/MocA family oxidoreductase [Chthoniobacteraceae bacterium]